MFDCLRENWTLKSLQHLPKIPSNLTEGFEKWNELTNKFDGVLTGDRRAYRNKNLIKTAVFTKYAIPQNVIEWIENNIIDEYFDIGVTYTQHGEEHLPHTDLYREYSLIYVLSPGGNNVITCFYSDGHEPLRKPNGTQPQNLDNLIEIDSSAIPCQTWTLLNSRVIHGVKNLTGTRIMIGVSFKKFPDSLFANKHFTRRK
jgi:hypothetical protein